MSRQHQGRVGTTERCTYESAKNAECPTVAFHFTAKQNPEPLSPQPTGNVSDVWRVTIEARTQGTGLHKLGTVWVNPRPDWPPNRTILIASLPGALAWAADVTKMFQSFTPREGAQFGFSSCPICIPPGITPIGGYCSLQTHSCLPIEHRVVAGAAEFITYTGKSGMFYKRVVWWQSGDGAEGAMGYQGGSWNWPKMSIPPGGRYEYHPTDMVNGLGWGILIDNSAGTGVAGVYAEMSTDATPWTG